MTPDASGATPDVDEPDLVGPDADTLCGRCAPARLTPVTGGNGTPFVCPIHGTT